MEVATRRREQEVWQACDDLWAFHGQFRFLTGDAIKEKLVSMGKSRGSPNEIYKYRKTWASSRAINPEASQSSSQELTDPISRAVKMVHEKLRDESNEHLEKIQLEHEKKLEELQKELGEKTKDLNQVIEEFSTLQKSFDECDQERRKNKNLLQAEIEVRKACEKEIEWQKNTNQQKIIEHEKVFQKIQNEKEKLQKDFFDRYETFEKNFSKNLIELEKEKKVLGQEYSEKLNQLKTTIYNQEINFEKIKIKFETLQKDFLQTEKKLEKNILEIDQLKKENNNLFLENAELKNENKNFIKQNKNLIADLKRCEIKNKKQDLMIAKLRAQLKR